MSGIREKERTERFKAQVRSDAHVAISSAASKAKEAANNYKTEKAKLEREKIQKEEASRERKRRSQPKVDALMDELESISFEGLSSSDIKKTLGQFDTTFAKLHSLYENDEDDIYDSLMDFGVHVYINGITAYLDAIDSEYTDDDIKMTENKIKGLKSLLIKLDSKKNHRSYFRDVIKYCIERYKDSLDALKQYGAEKAKLELYKKDLNALNPDHESLGYKIGVGFSVALSIAFWVFVIKWIAGLF